MNRLSSHLSYANVMATVAVFIALGGVSYAAITLPNNSVGPKQIKNNAVTSNKVKDRSLLAKDFKAAQLPAGAQGAQGIQGLVGPKGDKGDAGTSGTNGATNVVVRRDDTAAMSMQASCNPGERATGGGGFGDGVLILNSFPVPAAAGSTPTGWHVDFASPGGVVVYVVCASP